MLVDTIRPFLTANNSRLLFVNTTQEPMDVPADPRVTHAFLPYPHDYAWHLSSDHSSDRGLAFETRIVSHIKTAMKQIAAGATCASWPRSMEAVR
jgi:hypothetical protein